MVKFLAVNALKQWIMIYLDAPQTDALFVNPNGAVSEAICKPHIVDLSEANHGARLRQLGYELVVF